VKRTALLLVVLLVGCTTTTEDVRMDDRVAVFPSIRITHDLFGAPQTDQTARTSPTAAELDFHHASGTVSRDLGASQFIDFGGHVFNGPGQINQDYDLFAASLALRTLLNDRSRHPGVAVLAGLSAQFVRVQLDDGSAFADDRRLSIGPVVGLEGFLEPYSWLGLYVRGTQALGFGRSAITLGVIELGLSMRPHPRVALAGGYRRERYTQPEFTDRMFGLEEARVDLKLRGPTAHLLIDF
jgi:hypothetical protein